MYIGNYNRQELLDVNLKYLHTAGLLTEEFEFFLRRMYNYPYNIASFTKEIWEIQNSNEMYANVPAINDRYFLVCNTPIGSGGMGEVYPFWDKEEEKVVAFKIAKIISGGENRRLLREGEVLRRLQEVHPNIIKYQDLRIEQFSYLFREDAICLIMEYVEGRSLREYALKKGLYWYDMCRRENKKLDQLLHSNIIYIYKVGRALQALHKRGLVHRDVKPSNVIINNDDTPILIDFGIAQRIEAEGYLRTICSLASNIGTPPFMDPAIALSYVDLLQLYKDVEEQNWEQLLKNVKRPAKEYPTKMLSLTKKIKSVKRRIFWEKLLRKKKNTIVEDNEWEEMKRIIDEIRFCSDPQEDVYSLGATFYWALTGETLFSNPEQARMYYHNPSKIRLAMRMNLIDFSDSKRIVNTILALEKIIQNTLNPNPLKRWSCEKFCKFLEPFTHNIYSK